MSKVTEFWAVWGHGGVRVFRRKPEWSSFGQAWYDGSLEYGDLGGALTERQFQRLARIVPQGEPSLVRVGPRGGLRLARTGSKRKKGS